MPDIKVKLVGNPSKAYEKDVSYLLKELNSFSRLPLDLQRGSLVADYIGSLSRRKKLSSLPKIGLTINDEPISVSYVGNPPTMDLLPTFVNTNEFYSKGFRRSLERADNIRRYVGVCGSGEQHIQLLSILKNSDIKNVELYDTNVGQIWTGILTFVSYNKGLASNQSMDFGHLKTMKALKINSNINVNLFNENILKALSDAKPDVYFIYMSNALVIPVETMYDGYTFIGGSWMGFGESRKVLLKFIGNPNIKDGSLLMISDVYKHKHDYKGNVVLVKNGNKLQVYATSEGVDRESINSYLSKLKSKSDFYEWFNDPKHESRKRLLDQDDLDINSKRRLKRM